MEPVIHPHGCEVEAGFASDLRQLTDTGEVGEHRRAKTLLRFFRWFGKERTRQLQYICSYMWHPYLKVIAKKANQAIHILDRFHIMMHFNKAIDKVRAAEAKKLESDGYEPVLKKSRWLFLKRPENLTDKQDVSLRTVLEYNLKTIRSYLLKEDFQLRVMMPLQV